MTVVQIWQCDAKLCHDPCLLFHVFTWQTGSFQRGKEMTSLAERWLWIGFISTVMVNCDRQLDWVWDEIKDTLLGWSGKLFLGTIKYSGRPSVSMVAPSGGPDTKRLREKLELSSICLTSSWWELSLFYCCCQPESQLLWAFSVDWRAAAPWKSFRHSRADLELQRHQARGSFLSSMQMDFAGLSSLHCVSPSKMC